MLNRQAAPLIALILTLTVALTLACGPAAPAAQSHPPSAAAAAADPEATATPSPEPGLTPDLSYVAEAVYRLAEQQQNTGASGASVTEDGPRLPERIYVHVTAWTNGVDDMERLLRENGATDITVYQNTLLSGIESQAPPTLLPNITRHPAFVHTYTGGIYPNMEQSLDDALTMYAGGVQTAAETARQVMRNEHFPAYPENIVIKIQLDSPDSYSLVRDFLIANDAFPHDIKPDASWFYAGVPVAVMDKLYAHQSVQYIDRYPSYYNNEPGPASSMPAPELSQVTPTRSQGAHVHGALAWHSSNNTAADILRLAVSAMSDAG